MPLIGRSARESRRAWARNASAIAAIAQQHERRSVARRRVGAFMGTRVPTVREVARAVVDAACGVFGAPVVGEALGVSRVPEAALARWAMHEVLLRIAWKWTSWPERAGVMGCTSHTSAISAVKRCRAAMERDAEYAGRVERLERAARRALGMGKEATSHEPSGTSEGSGSGPAPRGSCLVASSGEERAA